MTMDTFSVSSKAANSCEMMVAACFTNSLQHLLAELERIDLLIQEQVQRASEAYQGDTRFQGLFVSEEDVKALLANHTGLPRWAAGEPPDSVLYNAHAELAAVIEVKERESASRGVSLRLPELARRFQLTRFEIDVLLICLAPELDLRYERLYAFLQDDIGKKRPSIDLVLNLLCHSFNEKVSARQQLSVSSTLLAHRLVHLFENSADQEPPLLSQYLKVDRRVVDYLLNIDELCETLRPFATIVSPTVTLDDLILPEESKDQLLRFVRSGETQGYGTVFYFHGPGGVGRQTAAEALCHLRGSQMLVVDGARLLDAEGLVFGDAIGMVGRELRLHPMAVYWSGFNRLLADDKRAELRVFLNAVDAWTASVFLSGDDPWDLAGALQDKSFFRLELQLPDSGQRVNLWRRALGGRRDLSESDIKALASTFRLSGSQICDAAATARHLARGRNPERPLLTLGDLNAACRLHSNQKLNQLAQKVTPHYRWDDIVLPKKQFAQLQEIYNCVKYRAVVYQGWGFDKKLSLGKGLNVLLAGPAGTGKTMSAEILATELGLDLYKIDLSAVVSKYIGETEKNLSRIFTEAATSNAILFFDEADALFGKRTEVKDSHDRYANIETGYLLQRIEEFEGIVVLATNLRNNLDDAFVRRIAFIVSLPLPGEENRLRIWEKIWPVQVPLANDLDLRFMARQFKLTGGDIKNIALAAAFLAADDGLIVRMDHVILATKRELEKAGKICVKSDFGLYYPLIAA